MEGDGLVRGQRVWGNGEVVLREDGGFYFFETGL